MASGVPDVLAELAAGLAALAPEHEGFRDYSRLNINPDTKREVDAAISQYDRRVSLMTAAQTALNNLMGDGYPALDVHEVTEAVYRDLAENEKTIAAALAKFSSNKATGLSLGANPAEPKPAKKP